MHQKSFIIFDSPLSLYWVGLVNVTCRIVILILKLLFFYLPGLPTLLEPLTDDEETKYEAYMQSLSYGSSHLQT